MKNANMDRVLDKAMEDFKDAYERLQLTIARYKVTKDEDDEWLEAIKDFRSFHDSTAGVEEFYEEKYTVTFAGHTVQLPFNADVWTGIDEILRTTIEEW